MQQQLSQRRSSGNNLRRFFYLILVIATTISLYLVDHYFLIKRVLIISPKKNQDNLNSLISKSLFSSENKLKSDFLKDNPLIRDVKLEKEFPDELIIKEIIDQPVAELVVDRGFFYLNSKAKIIKKTNKKTEENLPVINYFQKLNFYAFDLGDDIPYSDVKKTLNLLIKTKELGLKVINIDINGLDMIRFKLKENIIIFSPKKDILIQEYQLERIIKQFRIEGKNFQVLDLRFDKPIIKLQ